MRLAGSQITIDSSHWGLRLRQETAFCFNGVGQLRQSGQGWVEASFQEPGPLAEIDGGEEARDGFCVATLCLVYRRMAVKKDGCCIPMFVFLFFFLQFAK